MKMLNKSIMDVLNRKTMGIYPEGDHPPAHKEWGHNALARDLANKQREIDLQKAEADKLVRIKEAEADLEVAKKTAAVRLEKARAFKKEAEELSSAVTRRMI
ncbi:MAG: hypothetical protein V3R83_12345 [Gammaproteobacteria bacterium]